jgi:hypothetical protein
MNRIFLLVVFTAALGACAYDGKPRTKVLDSPICGGRVEGYTVAYLFYGESKMVMIPLSEVRPRTPFLVGLKPLDGFEDADVTVKGTSTKAIVWMTGVTKKYQDLPRGLYPKGMFEVGCVPNDPENTRYKFEVIVNKGDVTNTLDPRIEVRW